MRFRSGKQLLLRTSGPMRILGQKPGKRLLAAGLGSTASLSVEPSSQQSWGLTAKWTMPTVAKAVFRSERVRTVATWLGDGRRGANEGGKATSCKRSTESPKRPDPKDPVQEPSCKAARGNGLRPGETAGQESGSATAELAVTLPVIALLLVAFVLAGLTASTYIACSDGARTIVREISVGEAGSEAIAATGFLPGEVEIEQVGDWVHVTVSRAITSLIGGVRVTATAKLPVENSGHGDD